MWNDVETTQDLLNFKVVANAAAQMIKDGNGQPISIGVSGSWGVGKSSLIQMIGASLQSLDDGENYIFINFNAWLYQGYDDARTALLQKIADKIMDEAEARETCIDKAKEFFKRINWLRTAKFLAPVATGVIAGGVVAGPLGSLMGAVNGLFNHGRMPNSDELAKVQDAYKNVAPDLQKLLNEKEEKSVPKEVESLRALFEELLKKLNLTLIILVDDLDRCLPDTAISTLEAMRLLLFIPQTAFIIAADEQMIRNAVRSHFGNIDLSDDLVTSYFDKLIQIPLRVPRLGINEVKGYLILLFADLVQRRGQLTREEKDKGQNAIIGAVKKSWAGNLTKKMIEDAYGDAASKLTVQIDMADQLANIMATANHIAGNPRLIKRFLNNLIIRESVAYAQEMSVSFEELVKLQLFERCAPAIALEYLIKKVGDCVNGKPEFLKELEEKIAKGEDPTPLPDDWKDPFILEWLKLSPPLSDIDLRPLLYLSRDNAISVASFDELSPAGRELLSAICEVSRFSVPLIANIKQIGVSEAGHILTRMRRKARAQQWECPILIQALHLPKAFPDLATSFIAMLNEIPSGKRPAPLIPLLRDDEWANELLDLWAQDSLSPEPVRKAINSARRVK